ncbi:hypothetical protein GCM10017783_13110 [Deinococcus piscis]|uniref:DUF937 domain-containing protein n=1 Tax=Deinococcus piscis TaxID=394230 RepID=A0ABQ3KAB4_9DEIO|nr:DUF937 domain-containing protein [Deinococcus piscis]GHG02211.1 hypothetical protein GCM10017783_13110 [Deinococcus piscis]
MNIEELFRSRFGPESARELGQALGLEPELTARLLDRAVRSQLETVAQHAKSDAGRTQVLDAIANLPQFRGVSHALTEQGGAASLQLAGELLSPSLLGDDQTDLAGQLSRVEGAPQSSIMALMNMSLPLLLSFIGQAGVNEHTITGVMSTIRASGVRPRAAGGSYVSRAAGVNAPHFVDGGQAPAGETKKSAEAEAPAAPKVTAGGVPAVPPSQVQTPEGQKSEPQQLKLQQPEPELAQDTDYSKSSVVSALLDGAEVPEPGAVQRPAHPVAPTAPVKENPYRSQEAEQAEAPQADPELAQDTDYSKSSVVSALLDGAEVASPASVPPAPVPPAQAQAPQVPQTPATKVPATPPAAPVVGSVEVRASATDSQRPQADKPQQAQQDAPSQPTSPTPPQAATGGPSPEALAAAAAAAGIGAGVVRPPTAQAQPPAGSPWKSPQPVVVGAQPSATAVRPAAPVAASAVPAAPVISADSLAAAFRQQFSAEGLGALGEAAGFGRRDAGRAVQGTAAVLLSALAQKGRDEKGAAELLSLSSEYDRVTEGDGLNTALLGNRAELGALEVRGLSVLPRLLDNPSQVGGRLGTALGTSGEQAGRLLALLTPFVLGLLGNRARAGQLDAAGLSRVLGGLDAGRLESLLPEGLGVLKSLLGTQLFGAAPKERATLLETKQAKAAPAPGTPVTETAVSGKPAAPVQPLTPEPPRPVAPPPAPERRGGFPWWLLLLPLLAGLAWYFTQDRTEQPLPAPVTQTETTQTISEAATTETTGTTETVTTDAAAPVTEPAASAVAASDTVVVTAPAAGEVVPDTGFTMSGTGQPDTTYQLLEDGVSVGTFSADAAGAWTADVAAPAVGEHIYSVQDDTGTEVLSVPVTVEATEAAAACSEPMTLSLNDGETVSAPFRFGGVGDASGYQVRVLRGSEEIGTKDITLAANCTWNYLSQPGGAAGTTDAITYEVRSLDDLGGAPLQTINLNVVQAGE